MKRRISEPDRQPPPPNGGSPHDLGAAGGSDEPILLAEQGVYLAPGRSSWQIGQLNLTPHRLCFVQPRGVLFDLPLDWLLGAAVERKHYVIVRKPALAVTFQDPRLRDQSTAWFLTPLLGQWLARLNALLGLPAPPDSTWPAAGPPAPMRDSGLQIGSLRPAGSPGADRTPFTPATGYDTPRSFPAARQAGSSGLQIGSLRPVAAAPGVEGAPDLPGRAAARPAADGRVLRPPQTAHTSAQPPLTARDLARLASQLDPASRTILDYLAANSHATIRDLAGVLATMDSAVSDMQVLFSIRQNINPTARALLGRPVLFFVESQLDQVTGELVSYAWWLAGSRGRTPQWSETEAEVFDEGECLLVVVEMPGASAGAIACELEAERLTVRAVEADRRWRSIVPLPAAVETQPAAQHFNNGILSIHLRKQTKKG